MANALKSLVGLAQASVKSVAGVALASVKSVSGVVNETGAAPFSPTDLANLALWLDAGQIVGLSDNDAIGTWADASGNGKDATQATASAKPTYKTSIINSLPVARFDGGDSMVFAVDVAIPPIHLFAVLRPANTATYRYIISRSGSGAISWRIDNNHNPAILRSGEWGAQATTALSTATFSNIGLSYSSPNYAFRLNGADDGSGSSAQSMAAIDRLGIGYDGYPFNGDIAELIIYSAVLGTSDRNAVEAYLADKYGL